jgi:hypothetical protein
MGGSVNVKSEVGVGSTFSIIFKAMCKIPDKENLLSVPKKVNHPMHSAKQIANLAENK